MQKSIDRISKVIKSMESQKDVRNFLMEILTDAELSTLSKRWRILEMLSDGLTQREIASSLNVSLCKVTRGAKILKNKNAIITKIFDKGDNNENNVK